MPFALCECEACCSTCFSTTYHVLILLLDHFRPAFGSFPTCCCISDLFWVHFRPAVAFPTCFGSISDLLLHFRLSVGPVGLFPICFGSISDLLLHFRPALGPFPSCYCPSDLLLDLSDLLLVHFRAVVGTIPTCCSISDLLLSTSDLL